MNLSPNKLLEEKIINYFKNRKEVISIYLFGSYAEGKELRSSDIDIGILLDRKNQDFIKEKRNDYIVALGRILRKDIHPVILNIASEELLRQIFLKGKCLLINNTSELVRYKMIMFAKIADFAYYRNQMQSGFIRKIIKG